MSDGGSRICDPCWMPCTLYTEQPALTFQARGTCGRLLKRLPPWPRESQSGPPLELSVPAGLFVDMSRSRLVQALTNVLENAIESYDGLGRHEPVVVEAGIGRRTRDNRNSGQRVLAGPRAAGRMPLHTIRDEQEERHGFRASSGRENR